MLTHVFKTFVKKFKFYLTNYAYNILKQQKVTFFI